MRNDYTGMALICMFIAGSSDYTPGPFDVTFPAGMTTASFSVPIADDNLFEGSEVFTVTIVSSTLPSQVVEGADCVAVVTIVDDDSKFGFTH